MKKFLFATPRLLLFRKDMSSNSLNKFRPSDFQKRLLVWTKKYKSKDEIPQYVT